MALTKVGSGVIQDDAVGIANLGATGTASATTFLRGDNAWASAGGGFLEYVVMTATGTYTAGTSGHADVTKVVIEVQAGGGGGGAAASGSTNVGVGGAGGAYARKGPIAVTTGQTAVMTIGAKGDKGAYGTGSAGTAGGTSSAAPGTISFTTITCTGGGGGAASGGTAGTGGTVTSASATYDIRVDGGNGVWQYNKSGGDSMLGCGGEQPTASADAGRAGTGYGAGGSGGYGEAQGGGDGAPGIVIIAEYK